MKDGNAPTVKPFLLRTEPDRLTVGRLRAALAAFPDDAIVFLEGCDCSGEAGGVEVVDCGDDPADPSTYGQAVEITRHRRAQAGGNADDWENL